MDKLKATAQALKIEIIAVYLAARDPRTPWYAKAVAWGTVLYALSPIDLIPDFVPILGYLDDLLIVPAGLALARKLVPVEVMNEAREKSRQAAGPDERLKFIGGLVIALIWILTIIVLVFIILYFLREKK